MEVWIGTGNITQRRRFEYVYIVGVLGHRKAANVHRHCGLVNSDEFASRLPVGLDHAKPGKYIAAQCRTAVAAHAAVIHKYLQAGQLVIAQSLGIALEKFIKTVRCGERPLKGADSVGDVAIIQRLFFIWKCTLEPFDIAWHGSDAIDRIGLAGDRHFDRVEYRALRLLFHVRRAIVPELGSVECGVEHGGRVSGADRPSVTERRWSVIHALSSQVVPAVARDKTAL